MAKKLKFYVWKEIYADYTDGLACAVAESKEEAIQMLLKDGAFEGELRSIEPAVHDGKACAWVNGGG